MSVVDEVLGDVHDLLKSMKDDQQVELEGVDPDRAFEAGFETCLFFFRHYYEIRNR